MKQAVVASFALLLAACVTVPKGDPEALKPAVETIHQRFRWKDFRGAADLIVDEKVEAFLKARARLKDDRDLFITNFELEDAKLSPDTLSAKAFTKISWYRLPSTSEQTVLVKNVFVWRNEMWLLESQDEGPFEELKPAKADEPPKEEKPKQ
jgi:hypothetical protein